MNVDGYTKGVLTIIAACLVWMCLNGVTPAANAQGKLPAPTPVVLVDANGMPIYGPEGLRVTTGKSIFGVAVMNQQPLQVQVTNRSVPVAVHTIQRTGNWDPLQVHVLREPPTLKPVP
jgi:hypothetical protein